MRPRKLRTKFLLTLALMVSATTLFAQATFRYKADLQKVDTAGFFRIDLPPAVLAKSQGNLADIRLYDKSGKIVPYIFGDRLPQLSDVIDMALPVVKLSARSDTNTTFIAENKDRLTLSQLTLGMRNIDVERRGGLSGSDDLQNWYAIKEDIILSRNSSSGEKNRWAGNFAQQINFPASNYRYFRVQVYNGRRDGIAILAAFISVKQSIAPQYRQLPQTRISQKDTLQHSVVFIRLGDTYLVNKLHLDIAGAKYYKRNVSVYDIGSRPRSLLVDTVISSAAPADIYFSVKAKFIGFEIANEDNPPLEVKSITAYQLGQSLIAYLDKGNSYNLLVGDSVATFPNYDLQFFTDSVKRQLPAATLGAVTANPDFKGKEPKPAAKGFPAWALWAIIVAVLTALGAMTFKMTREVGKRG
ncbi:hypothetical protein [Mucilaginibacter gilvus]|uniref:DUF3999 family protein n=1 Tax=Mucilaginibacter gilvus TaxID=2305909 RepID=A0A3S3VH11_9SPHI|nr:hypothetical protein [Mucilaginibacter gilvus]RWY48129.1 hypothetical protein EPL05_21350 [Mucilaginibacter gilvus]